MCNLYSHTSNRQAVIDFTKAMTVAATVGKLEPQTGIFPDYPAPIVRNFRGMRRLTVMRWALPSSQRALYLAAKKRAAKLEAEGQLIDFTELLQHEPDAGTTNVRNIFDPEKSVGIPTGKGGWERERLYARKPGTGLRGAGSLAV